MPTVFVRHRLKDYAQWKPFFDEHEEVRREMGATAHQLFRDPNDANTVVIALQVQDLARAQQFVASDDLRAIMEQAGVQGQPEIWFGADIEQKAYR